MQGRNPYHVWTSTAFTDATGCTDGGKAYVAYYLDGTGWAFSGFCATTWASNGYTHFGSVRCVGFRMTYETKPQAYQWQECVRTV